jgi:hypothetical protein
MQVNFEQIKQAVLQLPTDEFEKFDEWYESQKQKNIRDEEKKARLKHQLERYRKARKWIDEHSREYMNKWVCLEGDTLIAVDDDGRTIYQKAKDAGIEIPFIHHIVDESLPFGGW